MIVLLSRRQIMRVLFGAFPLYVYFRRSEPVARGASDALDIVLVDGWILRREDLEKALNDAA